MDDLTTKIGIGSGAGLIGIVLGWFGFKAKISDIDQRINVLSEHVRYEDTCEKVHLAVDIRLESIETMQKEMRDDIKELVRR